MAFLLEVAFIEIFYSTCVADTAKPDRSFVTGMRKTCFNRWRWEEVESWGWRSDVHESDEVLHGTFMYIVNIENNLHLLMPQTSYWVMRTSPKSEEIITIWVAATPWQGYRMTWTIHVYLARCDLTQSGDTADLCEFVGLLLSHSK